MDDVCLIHTDMLFQWLLAAFILPGNVHASADLNRFPGDVHAGASAFGFHYVTGKVPGPLETREAHASIVHVKARSFYWRRLLNKHRHTEESFISERSIHWPGSMGSQRSYDGSEVFISCRAQLLSIGAVHFSCTSAIGRNAADSTSQLI